MFTKQEKATLIAGLEAHIRSIQVTGKRSPAFAEVAERSVREAQDLIVKVRGVPDGK